VEQFAGRHVLAVNDAIFKFFHCSSSEQSPLRAAVTLFSLDAHWVRRHRDFIGELDCEKYLALPLETWPDLAGIPGVRYLQWGAGDGLNENISTVNTGCHSGYGALGLAYHKRAWNIHLVGYDLDPAYNNQYQFWAKNYDATRDQLRKRNVAVWNHSPNSFIGAFPKVGNTGGYL